jgi:hypothetical protein
VAQRKRATAPRKQPIRGSSRSPVAEVEDDDDDDHDDDPIAQDQALALFFRRPPTAADHCVAIVVTPQGDHVLHDRTAAEVKARYAELANQTVESAERWARTEGRSLKFRVMWQQGDRVLGTYQWSCGEGDPTALDGTVESFLAQNQRHAEVDHRVHLEGFIMVQDAWQKQNASQQRRIEALEKDNELLRDRLRKAGDVDAEIAIQHAASDLEARERNANIMEHKVLPVLQHLLISRMNAANGTSAPPLAATTSAQASPATPATPAPATPAAP